MSDDSENEGTTSRLILWMIIAGIGIVFVAGAIAGFLAQHAEQGGGALTLPGTLVMAAFAAIIGGLAYSIWRNGRKIKLSNEPVGNREKLNNRVMVGSGLLGGLIALVLLVSTDITGGAPSAFTNTPIPPSVAIALVLIIGVGIPILSYYWHHYVIDEQEAYAYRSGALIAIYAYWTLAPTWWLLWRGGLVPAPDGIAIYFVTIFTALFIWFWKKYR